MSYMIYLTSILQIAEPFQSVVKGRVSKARPPRTPVGTLQEESRSWSSFSSLAMF